MVHEQPTWQSSSSGLAYMPERYGEALGTVAIGNTPSHRWVADLNATVTEETLSRSDTILSKPHFEEIIGDSAPLKWVLMR